MRYRHQVGSNRKDFGGGGGAGSADRMGRMGGNSPGAGPGGYCVCPNCGIQIEHQRGAPCYSVKCPKCGTEMRRE